YKNSVQSGRARPLFGNRQDAYNGDTLGAVSVGGMELFLATYRPLLLRTLAVGSAGLRIPGQSPAVRAVEVAAELAVLMREYGESVCAIVVEPMVQAAAGMLTYDAHFLREARRPASECGARRLGDEAARWLRR